MGAIDKAFLYDFESNLRVISVNEYARMLKSLWAPRITKTLTSKSKKEVIGWLLDSATIEDQGLGGNVAYDDMSMVEQIIKNVDAGKGLKIRKQQFEDLDGNGVQVGAKWTANISAYAAYWIQKQASKILKAGATNDGKTVCYDKKNLFSSSETITTAATGAHPFNPNDTAKGGFANWFTGAASGTQGYPGACPIDASVTIDVARDNLNKVIAYFSGAIRMPNGVDPRFLKVTAIVHPPALTGRVQQLTNSKFIAQAAATGGGSSDIEGMIRNYGFGEPIEAPELSAANGGSDTTYYVVCEEIAAGDPLGALIYQVREPFAIQFYSGSGSADGIDAVLYRAQELEWLTHGRYGAAPGHPFLIGRVDKT